MQRNRFQQCICFISKITIMDFPDIKIHKHPVYARGGYKKENDVDA